MATHPLIYLKLQSTGSLVPLLFLFVFSDEEISHFFSPWFLFFLRCKLILITLRPTHVEIKSFKAGHQILFVDESIGLLVEGLSGLRWHIIKNIYQVWRLRIILSLVSLLGHVIKEIDVGLCVGLVGGLWRHSFIPHVFICSRVLILVVAEVQIHPNVSSNYLGRLLLLLLVLLVAVLGLVTEHLGSEVIQDVSYFFGSCIYLLGDYFLVNALVVHGLSSVLQVGQ